MTEKIEQRQDHQPNADKKKARNCKAEETSKEADSEDNKDWNFGAGANTGNFVNQLCCKRDF